MGGVSEKDFDVVVFGATGVTGRRVARHLESLGDAAPKWAAAGRDASKVADVLAEEGVRAPATIVADVRDPASLSAMAARTRVVLDLVGPYTLYGRPVIAACIAQRAHYADLTGEMHFMRKVIDELSEAATAAGVKVVQPCGFESLPPDLAVSLATQTARERHGEDLATVDLEIGFELPPGRPLASDGISGGTFQTIVAALTEDEERLTLDPAALIPDPSRAAEVRRVSPVSLKPRRSPSGAALAPMIPVAYINPAVIQRSAMLTGNGGRPFRYREGVALNGRPATMPLRLAAAGVLAGMQAGVRVGIASGPASRRRIARFLDRVGPSSGFGPRPDRLEQWAFTTVVEARTTGGHAVTVRSVGHGHPGYLATAKMIAEAGILLAGGTGVPDTAGCLTPSLALGTESLKQFERAGLTFAIDA